MGHSCQGSGPSDQNDVDPWGTSAVYEWVDDDAGIDLGACRHHSRRADAVRRPKRNTTAPGSWEITTQRSGPLSRRLPVVQVSFPSAVAEMFGFNPSGSRLNVTAINGVRVFDSPQYWAQIDGHWESPPLNRGIADRAVDQEMGVLYVADQER